MKRHYTTTLRLDLDDEDDRRAWELLRGLDRKQYHSVSKAVAAAVNAFFGRQERLARDPYLETREKEDAFLREVREMIQEGFRGTVFISSAAAPVIPQAEVQPTVEETDSQQEDEDLDAALSFADSF